MCQCDICDRAVTSDPSSISDRGLPNVIKISVDLEDGLDKKKSQKECPVPVNLLCKNNTQCHYIFEGDKERRQSHCKVLKKIHCRSQSLEFSIKDACPYCSEFVDKTTKLPTHRRDQFQNAGTKALLSSVVAKVTAESWGHQTICVQNSIFIFTSNHNTPGLQGRACGRAAGWMVAREKTNVYIHEIVLVSIN